MLVAWQDWSRRIYRGLPSLTHISAESLACASYVLGCSHGGMRLPSLACDLFRLSPTKEAGTGESLRQFQVGAGDYSSRPQILDGPAVGPRGARRPMGVRAGGHTSLPRLSTLESEPLDVLAKVNSLQSGSGRADKSNWSSSATNAWQNAGTCPSATTRVPGPCSTGSS